MVDLKVASFFPCQLLFCDFFLMLICFVHEIWFWIVLTGLEKKHGTIEFFLFGKKRSLCSMLCRFSYHEIKELNTVLHFWKLQIQGLCFASVQIQFQYEDLLGPQLKGWWCLKFDFNTFFWLIYINWLLFWDLVPTAPMILASFLWVHIFWLAVEPLKLRVDCGALQTL